MQKGCLLLCRVASVVRSNAFVLNANRKEEMRTSITRIHNWDASYVCMLVICAVICMRTEMQRCTYNKKRCGHYWQALHAYRWPNGSLVLCITTGRPLISVCSLAVCSLCFLWRQTINKRIRIFEAKEISSLDSIETSDNLRFNVP